MPATEADSEIAVPRDAGGEIKTIARQYPVAWRFIIEALCRARKLSYVPGSDDARDLMVWNEGRRFVGEQLQRIAETPMPVETPPEPPARSMTEKARRRSKA